MSDILCMYYSRTGNTRKAMEELAAELGAEIVPLTDAVDRGGWKGLIRCGMDAMRQTLEPVSRFETEYPLEDYRLVILGTPIWAGRCCSVVRSFLKEYGGRLNAVSFVALRGSEGKFEEVYAQMDRYLARPHKTAVSLRSGSVGYRFWQEEFLRQTRVYLEEH